MLSSMYLPGHHRTYIQRNNQIWMNFVFQSSNFLFQIFLVHLILDVFRTCVFLRPRDILEAGQNEPLWSYTWDFLSRAGGGLLKVAMIKLFDYISTN